MNHPTLPNHTSLKTKLAVAAIGTGWITLVAGTFVALSGCMMLARIVSAPFKKL